MYGLTFKISFLTAQFRKHIIKLYWDTYLIPPPSAILGFVGAIMGVERRDLKEFAKKYNICTGAIILDYRGEGEEIATIIKYKGGKELIRTPKRSRFLYNPIYKFGIISSNRRIINMLKKRLDEWDFVFEVYGGSDYHFIDNIGDVRIGKYIETSKAFGYQVLDYVKRFIPQENGSIIKIDYLHNVAMGKILRYVFAYKALLETYKPKPAISDGEHVFYIHPSWSTLA